MKTVFIVGVTSGIGLAVAEEYLKRGDRVGGFGRNTDMLKKLETDWPGAFYGEGLDIRDSGEIDAALERQREKTGIPDLLLMSSSISVHNRDLDLEPEEDLIHTNVRGYTAVLLWAVRLFRNVGHGHVAGITSIAQFISSKSPGYSASKSWEAKYLDGLRIKTAGENIIISEIIPGFVRTPLISDRQSLFWVVPVEKAARQIVKGLDRKRTTLFISRRWRFVKWFIAIVPASLIRKIMSIKDNRV